MLFNSLLFLVFFAVVLGLHRLPLPWSLRKANLPVASYLFYAAWNPPFVLLLWLSTIVDWTIAKRIAATSSDRGRRALLLVTLCSNLGLLGYFKYGGFLLQTFTDLMAAVGVVYHPPAMDIVLPVGISFYTFQTLSYTLDVYLRRAKPADSFLDFALYVGVFPQLVAGPIVRATDFLPQCREPKVVTTRELGLGATLLVFGLFEKVVVADWLLSPSADAVFDHVAAAGTLDAWMGALAFSGQIFFDFGGYSMCAIGSAMCLGFHLPRNFHSPYASLGFSDFWRRWHITLSSWLRDYLYIPLGGNRHGPARTYMALMLTMLLGGLWHGASWTFVVWGGLHGLYLSFERVLKSRFSGYSPGPWALFGFGMLTYLLINITWVFFRADGFGKAWTVLSGMFGGNAGAKSILSTYYLLSVALIVSAIVFTHWRMRDHTLEMAVAKVPAVLLSAALGIMAFAIIIAQGDGSAFIYFQF